MRTLPVFVLLPFLATNAGAQNAPKVGDPPEARDMKLVGAHELQARSAYQPIVHEQNGRWIAFIGHHGGTQSAPKPVNALTGAAEFNGTSILDVTDPRAPKFLAHIPGEQGLGEQGGAQMVRWCPGRTLPKADKGTFYLLRTFGNSAHEVWDVTDPAKPALLTRIGRSRARTRTGGSAIPASPTSFRASRVGARGG